MDGRLLMPGIIIWCIIAVGLFLVLVFAVGLEGLIALPFPAVGLVFLKIASKEPERYLCAVIDRRVMRLSEKGFCAEELWSIEYARIRPSMYLHDRVNVRFDFSGKSSFDIVICGINCTRVGDFYDLPREEAELVVSLVYNNKTVKEV